MDQLIGKLSEFEEKLVTRSILTMSNIINLKPEDATADEVLVDAKGSYKDVLILGWDGAGTLNAKSTTSLDVKELVYMIEDQVCYN